MTGRMNDLIQVHPHTDPGYATINLTAVEDPELSWTAKGLYYHLATRPPDQPVTDEDLAAQATDGPTAVRSALRELEAHGYVAQFPV